MISPPPPPLLVCTSRSVSDLAQPSPSPIERANDQNRPSTAAPSWGWEASGEAGGGQSPLLSTVKESDPDEVIEPLIRAEFIRLKEAAGRWLRAEREGSRRSLLPAAFEKVTHSIEQEPDLVVFFFLRVFALLK